MAKILIHLTHGPEAPTQADRAFLIAKTALEEGHNVSMFLAGSAVQLMRNDILDSVIGVGEGVTSLRESYNTIIAGGGKIYLSKISCGARGMTDQELSGKQVELGEPNVLVRLTVEHDRVITYG
ncbi:MULTISPECIES: DsrE family protein [unclassified Paenibacillus]|uniref:DsrE family protein n=1 Tax=unclassified Paenibacillus TaxID=185978 RepID=UPI001AE1EAD1|nr:MULTISPECIES: DsrE family protein [unclassified Paenibacillus]MBP1154477.1 putative peroxiredoxin [Paenibacillus sp. PvP091]MBP1170139.1 putative peroxiredoxin [Paenibacillus sp. PvR098]MBP2441167.1 putative peroxiredoxin [Paenibacillus sp. PvP052]